MREIYRIPLALLVLGASACGVARPVEKPTAIEKPEVVGSPAAKVVDDQSAAVELRRRYADCIAVDPRAFLEKVASGDIPPKPVRAYTGDTAKAVDELNIGRKEFLQPIAREILDQGGSPEVQAVKLRRAVTGMALLEEKYIKEPTRNPLFNAELTNVYACDRVTINSLEAYDDNLVPEPTRNIPTTKI